MIMSISFNPCEMDYPAWLTVSGFIMAILTFFLNHVLDRLSDKIKIGYYTFLGYIVSFLIFIVIVGILCFIFNIKLIGAILVTIVLSALLISSLLLFVYIRDTAIKENEIDLLLPEYHSDID